MALLLWSDLPPELLELILKRISNSVGLLQCGAVCVSWRSIILEIYRELIPQLPPLLLVPVTRKSNREEEEEEDTHSLFNISTKKTHKIHIPQIQNSWFCGSTHGWLLKVDLNSPEKIQLLNPFSGIQIQLPPRSTFQEPQLDDGTYTEGYIVRVASSSSNPLDPNYTVLVIHCNKHKIAFCEPGDQSWKMLETPRMSHEDVIYFRGKFYVTDQRGNVLHCDLKSPNPRTILIVPPVRPNCFNHKYLVESSGKFLMVVRHLDWEEEEEVELTDQERKEGFISNTSYKTGSFEIFELDLSSKEWSEVKSLGDEALFLGHNESISISSRGSTVCRANCIYFTDDYWEGYFLSTRGCHDMGIYDLRTQSFEQLYDSSVIWRAPFHWITPDLHSI